MKFLDRFKTAAKPAQQEGDTEMSQTTEVAALAADDKSVELSAALSAKEAQFTELQAKFAAMETVLATLEADKASLAKQAKDVVMAARKEKLEAVLGTEGAIPVLATLENADETTFNTVLNAFSANREAEAKSKLFTEAGATGDTSEAAMEQVGDDTATRLAAKIAAQYKTA